MSVYYRNNLYYTIGIMVQGLSVFRLVCSVLFPTGNSITLQYLSVVSWSAGETICNVEPPAVQDGIFVWAESVFCPPNEFKFVELNLQTCLVA